MGKHPANQLRALAPSSNEVPPYITRLAAWDSEMRETITLTYVVTVSAAIWYGTITYHMVPLIAVVRTASGQPSG